MQRLGEAGQRVEQVFGQASVLLTFKRSNILAQEKSVHSRCCLRDLKRLYEYGPGGGAAARAALGAGRGPTRGPASAARARRRAGRAAPVPLQSTRPVRRTPLRTALPVSDNKFLSPYASFFSRNTRSDASQRNIPVRRSTFGGL